MPKNVQDRGGVLSKIDSTTKLLALLFLAIEAILVAMAARVEGTERLLFVGGIIIVLLVGVGGAIFLERERIRSSRLGSQAPLETPNEEPQTFKYDVFISSPMAALDNEEAYQKTKADIVSIKEALRKCCDFETSYYAGTDIETSSAYDAEHLALRSNVEALKHSKFFLMIYLERLPSSILVEAGMALAMKKPSVWFVRRREDLPFLLRGGEAASEKHGLPLIRVYLVQGPRDVVNRLTVDGAKIFE